MESAKPALSSVAVQLLAIFSAQENVSAGQKITVNTFISEIASWYEKLRNSMDYRADEVVLRAAIERILKRKLLLSKTGIKIAEPMVRELVWARYFPNGGLSEEDANLVAATIDNFLLLKKSVLKASIIKESKFNQWILDVMSAAITRLLLPQKEREAVASFMFYTLKDTIDITDDTKETACVQVFLAVRRAFAKDDVAFLHYYLFQQIFGELTAESLPTIVSTFGQGYREIERQLTYPLREKIYLFIKRQTPVFFILQDLLQTAAKDPSVIADDESLQRAVFALCTARYNGIAKKVRTAIFRSVLFLLFTKAIFAFAIEGTYDRIRYGGVVWLSIIVNMVIPPILMILVGIFIKTPNQKNSSIIFDRIKLLLISENPQLSPTLHLQKAVIKKNPLLHIVFTILWIIATMASFGVVVFVLSFFHFNIVSQCVFIFFLTIVSFLSYRINLTAKQYAIEQGQGMLTPIIDFLFLPIVRMGMQLTDGVSQINLLIFLFDIVIEAPFKTLFGFFEQWFAFLHTKREGLE